MLGTVVSAWIASPMVHRSRPHLCFGSMKEIRVKCSSYLFAEDFVVRGWMNGSDVSVDGQDDEGGGRLLRERPAE